MKYFFLVFLLFSHLVFAEQPKIQGDKNCLTLDFVDLPIIDALRVYFDSTKQDFVIDKNIKGNIELHLNCISASAVLEAIVSVSNIDVKQQNGIYYVTSKVTQQNFSRDSSATSVQFASVSASAQKEEPKVRPFGIAKTVRIYNVPPAELVLLLEKLDLDVKVFDTNQIYLNGTQAAVDKAQLLIAQLDKPKRQYMVNAKLIATSDSFMENIGTSLGANITTVDNQTALTTTLTAATAAVSGGTSLIVQKLGSVVLSAKISAAVSDGDAVIVSEPRTIAYDGKESSITQGARIPYQTQMPQGGYQISFIDAALTLKVIPRAGDAKDRIILDVFFTKNSAGTPSPAGIQINTREIKTTVALKSGETVILGGIDELNNDSTETGIPYLRDIPILGYAFGSKLDNANQSKIVLMLTPTIIN